MTRLGSNYANTVGAFVGAFWSFGVVSAAVQIDVPAIAFGEGSRMPLLSTIPIALKLVFPFDVRPSTLER